MASDRAMAFAKDYVGTFGGTDGWYTSAFGLSEWRGLSDEAGGTAECVREEIADALDAYEAEAWTLVKDGLPKEGRRVQWWSHGDTFSGIRDGGRVLFVLGTYIDVADCVAWRPMPAGPKELRDDG